MNNSTRLLPLLLTLLGPLSLSAQESRNGPKLGIDIGTQTAGQFLAWSGLPKLGFIAGWSFEAPLTQQVSLLIEPMYIGKGSVIVNSVQKTRSSTTLNYLELPLLLKVSTNPDPQGLYLCGGLLYGYFLHGTTKDYQNGELKTQYRYSPSTNTNRSQWSAAFGLGQEVGPWLVELRGQSSLNTFDLLVRSHNVVYSLQATWRFPTQVEKQKRRAAKTELED
ncbi:MAG: outer membrane beta-barrel protein [Flavobacteriales bacterium]|nr:outer membrane beta-barrel protein [Flavobacteriales bacterium]MBP9079875.1 outer membrane beta-barrel protein [Flavobacteriales bacterium]